MVNDSPSGSSGTSGGSSPSTATTATPSPGAGALPLAAAASLAAAAGDAAFFAAAAGVAAFLPAVFFAGGDGLSADFAAFFAASGFLGAAFLAGATCLVVARFAAVAAATTAGRAGVAEDSASTMTVTPSSLRLPIGRTVSDTYCLSSSPGRATARAGCGVARRRALRLSPGRTVTTQRTIVTRGAGHAQIRRVAVASGGEPDGQDGRVVPSPGVGEQLGSDGGHQVLQ